MKRERYQPTVRQDNQLKKKRLKSKVGLDAAFSWKAARGNGERLCGLAAAVALETRGQSGLSRQRLAGLTWVIQPLCGSLAYIRRKAYTLVMDPLANHIGVTGLRFLVLLVALGLNDALVAMADPVNSNPSHAELSERPLNPQYPVVSGRYLLSKEWEITLPGKFNRRIEDGSLVIWRPGLTLWIGIWAAKAGESPRDRLELIKSGRSPAAQNVIESTDGELIRYGFRMQAAEDKAEADGWYTFTIGAAGHVQMAIYFDDEADLATAQSISRTVRIASPDLTPTKAR